MANHAIRHVRQRIPPTVLAADGDVDDVEDDAETAGDDQQSGYHSRLLMSV